MTDPRFSVVIPLYNKRPYIGRAVASVLAQTLTDFELIVVDDGSTDGSADALSELKDLRLNVVHQCNQGVGQARNTGLSRARGYWVAFLDADDAWTDCHLAELERIAAAQPLAGLISTTCIESTGAEIPVALAISEGSALIREVDYFMEAAKKIGFINSTSAAIRCDVAKEVGFFSERKTGEDLEYWIRAALKYPVAVSARVTCVYFRDTDGAVQRITKERDCQPEPPLKSIREFSTPVALLYALAEEDEKLLQRSNIRIYINGVLHVALRGSLYRGHFLNARHYAGMFLAPLGAREYVMFLLRCLPIWLLRFLRCGVLLFKKRANPL